jgi:hypothetical protein
MAMNGTTLLTEPRMLKPMIAVRLPLTGAKKSLPVDGGIIGDSVFSVSPGGTERQNRIIGKVRLT